MIMQGILHLETGGDTVHTYSFAKYCTVDPEADSEPA